MLKYVLAISLLGVGCSDLNTIKQVNVKPKFNILSAELYDGTIKIEQESGGRCSAFVISNKLAFTAKHCLANEWGFLYLGQFSVYGRIMGADKANLTTITAKVHSYSRMFDTALIEGDFKRFTKFNVDVTNERLLMYRDKQLVACGYALGQDYARCFTYRMQGRIINMYQGKGYGIWGMSGGPVFDPDTGHVVGVMSAMGEGHDDIYISSLFGYPLEE